MWSGTEISLTAWHAVCRILNYFREYVEQCKQVRDFKVKSGKLILMRIIGCTKNTSQYWWLVWVGRCVSNGKYQDFCNIGRLRVYTKRVGKMFLPYVWRWWCSVDIPASQDTWDSFKNRLTPTSVSFYFVTIKFFVNCAKSHWSQKINNRYVS